MLRQSPFKWLVLAGIMLLIAGFLLDLLLGKTGNVHLVLGMPSNPTLFSRDLQKSDAISRSVVNLKIDSIQVEKDQPGYELQVREIDQEFSQSVHANMNPPSHLLAGFPLSPMKIQKVADTEFRFRLKQFYPDFTFNYNYPENRDTIPPNAPGITLNLITPDKEDVVTLRSDKPNLRKLDDVVGLGCGIYFFWTLSQDSVQQALSDTALDANKILLVGKDKKVYWFFDGKLDSTSLENKYYAIPGRQGIGFTVLQVFPDARWLKAEPGTKSDQLLNPVAEVEVWKLGEGAQTLFLYPNAGGRHGGEWKVPGKSMVLTCAVDHKMVVDACQCKLNVHDTVQHVMATKMIRGRNVLSFGKTNAIGICCFFGTDDFVHLADISQAWECSQLGGSEDLYCSFLLGWDYVVFTDY